MEIWVDNFRSVRRSLTLILTRREIEPIALPEDMVFDAKWHQATESVPHPDLDSDTILEVVKPGYWHPATGRILSKVQVKVVS